MKFFHLREGQPCTVRFLDTDIVPFGKHFIPGGSPVSADNGVYVLPVESSGKTFYFVAERQAIDNMMWNPDRKDGYNNDQVLKFLVETDRYIDRARALEAAHAMHSASPFCEYGVVILEPVKLEN